jgi:hypothetical protein
LPVDPTHFDDLIPNEGLIPVDALLVHIGSFRLDDLVDLPTGAVTENDRFKADTGLASLPFLGLLDSHAGQLLDRFLKGVQQILGCRAFTSDNRRCHGHKKDCDQPACCLHGLASRDCGFHPSSDCRPEGWWTASGKRLNRCRAIDK